MFLDQVFAVGDVSVVDIFEEEKEYYYYYHECECLDGPRGVRVRT